MKNIKDVLNASNQILFICSEDMKQSILLEKEQLGFFSDVKYLTKEGLLKQLTFSYKTHARLILSKHFNISIEHSEQILSVLPFLYLNKAKNHRLFSYFDFLFNHGLLEFLNFKSLYKFYDVYLLDDLDPIILKTLQEQAKNVYFLDLNVTQQSPYSLMAFSTMADEVNYVCDKIARLIDSGIEPHLIKVHATSGYMTYIELIFDQFNLAVNNKYGYHLYQIDITKDIINHLETTSENNFDTLFKINDLLLNKYLDYSNEAHDVYQKLMSILNNYLQVDLLYKDMLADIIYTFKHTRLNYPDYKNGITVGNILPMPESKDMHVFVLGLNASEIPTVYTNNGFLDDNEKIVLGIYTSYDDTVNSKKTTLNALNSINHLYISYKESTPQGEAFSSYIIDEIKRKKHVQTVVLNKVRYAPLLDKIKLKLMLENFETYGIKDAHFDIFYRQKSLHSQQSYDPSFNGINNFDVSNSLNNFSFTKLNDYFLCGYKFYLKHILNLPEDFRQTNSLHIGNFFHDVLKDYMSIDESSNQIEKMLTAYLQDNELELSTVFFLQESLVQLKNVIKHIKEIEKRSDYVLYQTELEINMPIHANKTYNLIGKIDKIMKHQAYDEKIYIVDYKTGSALKPIDYIFDGINSQLLFYLLFLKKNLFSSPYFTGFFYQNIYTNVLNTVPGKTYEDIQKNHYSLQGYKINDVNQIRDIDPLFDTLETISKTGIKKDGSLTKTAWTFDHNKLSFVLDDFETLIINSIRKIENGQFEINPVIGTNVDSCNYCSFRDICYLNKAKRTLEKNNPFGGSDNEDSQ